MNWKKKIVPIYKKCLNSTSRGHGLGKNPVLRKIVKKTESVLKSNSVFVHGNEMFLDKWDALDLSINGVYNDFDTKVVKEHIKLGDKVIDVGAHIGYFSLLFSKLVGEKGNVYSFEPEPKNIKLLKKNIAVNNIQNITLEPHPVSNINENCKLYVGQFTSGANRIYRPDRTMELYEKDTINIQTLVLDDYFSKLNLTNKIDFVKIDAEGSELRILQGMSKILRENKNLKIFIEFMRDTLEEAGSDPEELLNLLEREGFKIYYVDDHKNKVVVADKNLLMTSDIYITKTVNLLCIKEVS